jgi:iron complex transport system ATP-binding protein
MLRMISIKNIHYSIGKINIIKDISLAILPGEFTMILGTNGSGKSTLLKLFSSALNPTSGEIFYNDENLSLIKNVTIAKRRAVLSQRTDIHFPITAKEIVMMGRYPHFNFSPNKNDEDIVQEVMQLMDVEKFAERNYLTLSGGEKQRVQFARALAQIWNTDTETISYLFMDEPLTGLDIHYQLSFLKIATSLLHKNLILVAVMHDINLAMQYADKLIFLKDGTLAAMGKPNEIVNPTLIENVFNVQASFIDTLDKKNRVVVFEGK